MRLNLDNINALLRFAINMLELENKIRRRENHTNQIDVQNHVIRHEFLLENYDERLTRLESKILFQEDQKLIGLADKNK